MTDPMHSVVRRLATPLLLATLVACQSGANDAAQNESASAQSATAATTPAPAAPADSAAGAATGAAAGGATAGGAATAAGAMLDPNSATREQLLAVPSMNAAAADALVAGRPYENMVAVDRALATHVGAAERKTVYARLWKPIDLNSARGEEILLIPGVGPRMQHEFEEYRPYRSIEQFRREIGKYVSKDEVARLEQYVTIR